MPDEVDVIVRTFNSGRTLEECLKSIVECIPYKSVIVVDHCSTDSSIEIARRFGCTVFTENTGLGYATVLGAESATTPFVLYVDSDVRILRKDFLARAMELMELKKTGAVVGTSLGHRFLYGLPLGLTLLPRSLVLSASIKYEASGRETYYLQRELRRRGLRVRYVTDAMLHTSPSRLYRYRPEWQGAQMRDVSGFELSHLIYAFFVVLLMHMNTRSPRNILYTPVFYAKLVRGFLHPIRWGNRPPVN